MAEKINLQQKIQAYRQSNPKLKSLTDKQILSIMVKKGEVALTEEQKRSLFAESGSQNDEMGLQIEKGSRQNSEKTIYLQSGRKVVYSKLADGRTVMKYFGADGTPIKSDYFKKVEGNISISADGNSYTVTKNGKKQTYKAKNSEQGLVDQNLAKLNNQEKYLKETKKEQGWIGKGWDGLKNLTGIGAGSDKAQSQIDAERKLLNQIKTGKVSKADFKEITGVEYTKENLEKFKRGELSKVAEKIDGYKEGQDMATDVIADVVSGVAAFTIYSAAIVAAPFTGGASIAVGVAVAAASGAIIKVGVKALDTVGTDKKYTMKNLKHDALTGAVSGLLAPITAGFGGAVGKTVATKLGIQAVKSVGKEVAEEVAKGGVKATLKTALTNPAGYEYIGGTALKRGTALATEMVTDGALSGTVDGAFRAGLDSDWDSESMTEGAIQGGIGGAIMSPIIGGGMKAIGKGIQKAFGKENVKIDAKGNKVADNAPNVDAKPPKAGDVNANVGKSVEKTQVHETPIQTQQRLIDELKSAKTREDFKRITQEIKNLPKTEEWQSVKQRLGSEYMQRYNAWKSEAPESVRNIVNMATDENSGIIRNDLEKNNAEIIDTYSWNTKDGKQFKTASCKVEDRLSGLVDETNLENGLLTTKAGRQKAYDKVRAQIDKAYDDSEICGAQYDRLVERLNLKANAQNAGGIKTSLTEHQVSKNLYDSNKNALLSTIEKMQFADFQSVKQQILDKYNNGEIDLLRFRELVDALETKAGISWDNVIIRMPYEESNINISRTYEGFSPAVDNHKSMPDLRSLLGEHNDTAIKYLPAQGATAIVIRIGGRGGDNITIMIDGKPSQYECLSLVEAIKENKCGSSKKEIAEFLNGLYSSSTIAEDAADKAVEKSVAKSIDGEVPSGKLDGVETTSSKIIEEDVQVKAQDSTKAADTSADNVVSTSTEETVGNTAPNKPHAQYKDKKAEEVANQLGIKPSRKNSTFEYEEASWGSVYLNENVDGKNVKFYNLNKREDGSFYISSSYEYKLDADGNDVQCIIRDSDGEIVTVKYNTPSSDCSVVTNVDGNIAQTTESVSHSEKFYTVSKDSSGRIYKIEIGDDEYSIALGQDGQTIFEKRTWDGEHFSEFEVIEKPDWYDEVAGKSSEQADLLKRIKEEHPVVESEPPVAKAEIESTVKAEEKAVDDEVPTETEESSSTTGANDTQKTVAGKSSHKIRNTVIGAGILGVGYAGITKYKESQAEETSPEEEQEVNEENVTAPVKNQDDTVAEDGVSDDATATGNTTDDTTGNASGDVDSVGNSDDTTATDDTTDNTTGNASDNVDSSNVTADEQHIANPDNETHTNEEETSSGVVSQHNAEDSDCESAERDESVSPAAASKNSVIADVSVDDSENDAVILEEADAEDKENLIGNVTSEPVVNAKTADVQTRTKGKPRITPAERRNLTERIQNAKTEDDIRTIQTEIRKYKRFEGRKNLRKAYKAKLRQIRHQDGTEKEITKYEEKFKKRMNKIINSDVYQDDSQYLNLKKLNDNSIFG